MMTEQIALNDVFSIIESIGILASILFAIYAIVSHRKSQQLSNHLMLTESHREVWKIPLENENIRGILDINFDKDFDSLTYEERQFLSFLFLHAGSAFELVKAKNIVEIEGFKKDMMELLSLPAPLMFWRQNRKYYNKDFVIFVETIMKEVA